MPLPRFHRLDPQRQAQILDAAAEEFGARGYSGASMNRIIEAAELSKGAMYYYFDGKADVWATLLEGVLEELGPMDSVFAGVTDAPAFWAAFEALFASTHALHERSPRMANVMRATLTSTVDESMLAATTQGMEGMRKAFAAVFELGQSVGAVRRDLSVDQLVELTFATNSVTDRWIAAATLEGAATEELIKTVVDINIRMLKDG